MCGVVFVLCGVTWCSVMRLCVCGRFEGSGVPQLTMYNMSMSTCKISPRQVLTFPPFISPLGRIAFIFSSVHHFLFFPLSILPSFFLPSFLFFYFSLKLGCIYLFLILITLIFILVISIILILVSGFIRVSLLSNWLYRLRVKDTVIPLKEGS